MTSATPAPIPGPRGLRQKIKFYIEFRRSPVDFLRKAAARYGDVVRIDGGSVRIHFLNHPDLVRRVLVSENENFRKSRALQLARRFLGDGLLTSEGELHRRLRRLATPAFQPSRIREYAVAMLDRTSALLAEVKPGEVRELGGDMTRLTLGIVAMTLFHADVEREAVRVGRALTEVMAGFNRILTSPVWRLLPRLPLPFIRRMERAQTELDEVVAGFIHDRRHSPVQYPDLLQRLMDARDDEGDGSALDDRLLRDQLLTLFLAGHETTANALTWAFYLLGRHPDVAERLREEVNALGRQPTADDLDRLEYTGRVFSEAIRLYPPAWAIGREPLSDFRVQDYVIPRGSVILLSPYVMQRDGRFFEEPDRFDPDRWLPDRVAKRPRWSYFPFGAGPRWCIGEHFARAEGVLILATISRRFRLVPSSDAVVRPRALITLRPAGPVPVRWEAV